MTLNKLLSRIFAVTILIVMVLVGISVTVAPLVSRYEQDRQTVRTSARQIAQFQALIKNGPAIRKQLEDLKGQNGQTLQLLEGDSDAIVGAKLQDRVRRAIADARGSQRSAQMLPPREIANQVQTGVKVVATVSTSELLDLLNNLETGTPTILLDNVSIRTNVRSSRLGNASTGSTDPELTLGFTAYGFAKREAVDQGGAPDE